MQNNLLKIKKTEVMDVSTTYLLNKGLSDSVIKIDPVPSKPEMLSKPCC